MLSTASAALLVVGLRRPRCSLCVMTAIAAFGMVDATALFSLVLVPPLLSAFPRLRLATYTRPIEVEGLREAWSMVVLVITRLGRGLKGLRLCVVKI